MNLPSTVRDRLVVVWALLVLATVVSVWLGTDHGFSGDDGRKVGTALVLAVAVLKIHVVGMHFMDLRTAPPALRWIFDSWCLVVGGTLIVLVTQA